MSINALAETASLSAAPGTIQARNAAPADLLLRLTRPAMQRWWRGVGNWLLLAYVVLGAMKPGGIELMQLGLKFPPALRTFYDQQDLLLHWISQFASLLPLLILLLAARAALRASAALIEQQAAPQSNSTTLLKFRLLSVQLWPIIGAASLVACSYGLQRTAPSAAPMWAWLLTASLASVASYVVVMLLLCYLAANSRAGLKLGLAGLGLLLADLLLEVLNTGRGAGHSGMPDSWLLASAMLAGLAVYGLLLWALNRGRERLAGALFLGLWALPPGAALLGWLWPTAYLNALPKALMDFCRSMGNALQEPGLHYSTLPRPGGGGMWLPLGSPEYLWAYPFWQLHFAVPQRASLLVVAVAVALAWLWYRLLLGLAGRFQTRQAAQA